MIRNLVFETFANLQDFEQQIDLHIFYLFDCFTCFVETVIVVPLFTYRLEKTLSCMP